MKKIEINFKHDAKDFTGATGLTMKGIMTEFNEKVIEPLKATTPDGEKVAISQVSEALINTEDEDLIQKMAILATVLIPQMSGPRF